MKLGVIGAGNMASAIVRGLVLSKALPAGSILVSDLDAAKLKTLEALGVHTYLDNAEVIQNADTILLAVKPNVYPMVLRQAAQCPDVGTKLLISIAPGISIADMKSYFSEDMKVIRTMPNTPAMVGEGMTVLCSEAPVTETDLQSALDIFQAVGKTCVLPETLLNSVVALNGSSPAYIFVLIEAMADAAVRDGIPRAMAYEIAAQSVLGSAKMVLETHKHPGELKDMVCSPAGTTIDAVAVLEKAGFRSAIMDAMAACTEKAQKMAKK